MDKKIIKTVCNLCGLSGCGMEITMLDGRITEIKGDKDHPESHGVLCPKGLAMKDIFYSPDRLKYPLKRVGWRGEGKWEQITWDQAMDIMAEKLQQVKKTHGPEAVWFHKGSGHDLCGGDVRVYLHRLANLFGTPNISCPFFICNGPRTFNMFITTGGIPAPDVENTNCAVLWGINPTVTAIARHVKIHDAVKRGAKLIVIDPRATHFARKADVHLRPRPGSDGALALGLLRVITDENLFDADFVTKWTVGFGELKTLLEEYPLDKVERITWVPKEEIIKAARIYAGTKPACIFLGQTLDQQTNTSQAIRAITDLIAITGNLDMQGGNVILSPVSIGKNPVALHDKLPLGMNEKRLGCEFPLTQFEFTKLAHPPSGYKAILTGKPYPVKAMFILAANPVLMDPDSQEVQAALKKLDFLAVADIFMTRTAEYADLVLPACTFLEQTYYATYEAGAYLKPANPGLLMLRPQVVPPLGESWPDWKIIFELARKLGYGEYFPWKDIEAAIDYELEPFGITSSKLYNHPEGIPIPAPSFLYQKFAAKGQWGRLMIYILNRTMFRKYPNMFCKYKKIGFTTPSKKVEIMSEKLKEMGFDSLPVYHEPSESPLGDSGLARTYPLVLTTGAKLDWFVHSQMHNIPSLSRRMPHNVAEINTATAADYKVKQGDTVRIETPRASINCQVMVSEDILQQVVQVFPGFKEANANLLTNSSVYDPVTGSVPMRASLCRVSKVLS
jgi:anaerobic selenocysteine-containing dehydrogenase